MNIFWGFPASKEENQSTVQFYSLLSLIPEVNYRILLVVL
jgi:hypothetical protein